jgi:hypothetical protein
MVEGQGGAGLQDYLGDRKTDPTAFLFALGQTYAQVGRDRYIELVPDK